MQIKLLANVVLFYIYRLLQRSSIRMGIIATYDTSVYAPSQRNHNFNRFHCCLLCCFFHNLFSTCCVGMQYAATQRITLYSILNAHGSDFTWSPWRDWFGSGSHQHQTGSTHIVHRCAQLQFCLPVA